MPHLCGLHLRFRLHSIVLLADIEKAFLQLGIQPSHQDVTRLLWLKDIAKLEVDDNIVVYCFLSNTGDNIVVYHSWTEM